MALAPLSFLRGKQPTRTPNWDKNPVVHRDTLNRRFSIRFGYHEGSFYNREKFPSHDQAQHTAETIYHPPPHYHLFSHEYFHIARGTGIIHLWDRDIRLSTGDSYFLPTRTWHWFEGDASLADPLDIQISYDPSQASKEERFFRNVMGYLEDSHREGIPPSVFQLMIFFAYFDTVTGFRLVRWERLNMLVNTVLVYALTGIGLLMGYRPSYREYYDPGSKGI